MSKKLLLEHVMYWYVLHLIFSIKMLRFLKKNSFNWKFNVLILLILQLKMCLIKYFTVFLMDLVNSFTASELTFVSSNIFIFIFFLTDSPQFQGVADVSVSSWHSHTRLEHLLFVRQKFAFLCPWCVNILGWEHPDRRPEPWKFAEHKSGQQYP